MPLGHNGNGFCSSNHMRIERCTDVLSIHIKVKASKGKGAATKIVVAYVDQKSLRTCMRIIGKDRLGRVVLSRPNTGWR